MKKMVRVADRLIYGLLKLLLAIFVLLGGITIAQSCSPFPVFLWWVSIVVYLFLYRKIPKPPQDIPPKLMRLAMIFLGMVFVSTIWMMWTIVTC